MAIIMRGSLQKSHLSEQGAMKPWSEADPIQKTCFTPPTGLSMPGILEGFKSPPLVLHPLISYSDDTLPLPLDPRYPLIPAPISFS